MAHSCSEIGKRGSLQKETNKKNWLPVSSWMHLNRSYLGLTVFVWGAQHAESQVIKKIGLRGCMRPDMEHGKVMRSAL